MCFNLKSFGKRAERSVFHRATSRCITWNRLFESRATSRATSRVGRLSTVNLDARKMADRELRGSLKRAAETRETATGCLIKRRLALCYVVRGRSRNETRRK